MRKGGSGPDFNRSKRGRIYFCSYLNQRLLPLPVAYDEVYLPSAFCFFNIQSHKVTGASHDRVDLIGQPGQLRMAPSKVWKISFMEICDKLVKDCIHKVNLFFPWR